MKDAIARVAKRKAGLSTLTPVTPETKHGQGGKRGLVVRRHERIKLSGELSYPGQSTECINAELVSCNICCGVL